MLIESVVIFSTPSHLLETIYAIQIGDIPYISNSLAFLLERSGSNLDHEYFDYQLDMCSSMFGPENQIGSSPLKDNRRLMYYRCCNISVEEDLKIVKEDKHSNLVFSDYASYRNEISGVIDRVSQNATSASRKKYGTISTISSGYDAVATSVLAHEAGCDSVITFFRPAKYAWTMARI